MICYYRLIINRTRVYETCLQTELKPKRPEHFEQFMNVYKHPLNNVKWCTLQYKCDVLTLYAVLTTSFFNMFYILYASLISIYSN
jgi:hypothetical protein